MFLKKVTWAGDGVISDWESFWKLVSKDRFPKLKDVPLKTYSIFRSTCVCENTFLVMESRDVVSVSWPIFVSLGLEGFKSLSQAYCFEILHTLKIWPSKVYEIQLVSWQLYLQSGNTKTGRKYVINSIKFQLGCGDNIRLRNFRNLLAKLKNFQQKLNGWRNSGL